MLPQLESSSKFQLELLYSPEGSHRITVHSSTVSFCFISNKFKACRFLGLCYKALSIKVCLREVCACRKAGKLYIEFIDSLLALNQQICLCLQCTQEFFVHMEDICMQLSCDCCSSEETCVLLPSHVIL